ncbi:MAG TPA: cytochrome c [Gemmatimonadaceae bacterium]|nr:cytochrome c [Gemmatimonadaceae bacterium]
MTRREWRQAALLTAAALLSVAACSREHGTVAPSFERMLVQPRYEPYGASSFFPDGRAMRIPPSGTVSRERLADSALIPAAMAPAALTDSMQPTPVESMPLQPSDELLAVGQSRFGIYCAVCHGVLGDGNSTVAKNMVECPPPSLLSAAVRALPPATLFQVITDGFGRMPPYATELPVEQRWAVIAYMRQLQSRAPPDSGLARREGAGCGSRS